MDSKALEIVKKLIQLEKKRDKLRQDSYRLDDELNELMANKKVRIIGEVEKHKHKRDEFSVLGVPCVEDVVEVTDYKGRKSSIREVSVTDGELRLGLKNGLWLDLEEVEFI